MKKTILKPFLTGLLVAAIGIPAIGQKSLVYQEPAYTMARGKAFFEDHRYQKAQGCFEKVLNQTPTQSVQHMEATFFFAKSAFALNQEGAEQLILDFRSAYPQSQLSQQGAFLIGKKRFEEEKYRQVIKWFKKCDPQILSQEEQAEYYFYQGYAFLEQKETKSARVAFKKAKQYDSPLSAGVAYFLAYLDYAEGKFDKALEGFLPLAEKAGYETVVPYYISQIYFVKEDYAKVADYGQPLLEEANEEQKVELLRLIGNAYSHLGDHQQAIAYLEQYRKATKTPGREEMYLLGLSYFDSEKWNEAATVLAQVATKEDELSQNSYFYLGSTYLKLGDKEKSRLAFDAAARYDFNRGIKEEALFNYAKLTYELSFSPFNEIINSFEQFLELFPDSKHVDDVYDLLASVLRNTQNYEAAYNSLLKIKKHDPRIEKSLQRVTYYRGVELFQDMQLQQAITFWDKSLKYGRYDRDLKLQALYWKGEAFYRLQNYDKAQQAFYDFLTMPGANRLPQFAEGHYSLGYSYFKEDRFGLATSWFDKYLKLHDQNADRVVDANNRIGDCYYLTRDFDRAIASFDGAIRAGGDGVDYAMFRKGFVYGIMDRSELKISTLDRLSRQYPRSPYVDDALYEAGRAFMTLKQPYKAIGKYKQLLERYPNSSYGARTLAQLGLAYYNSGDQDQALDYYKKLVAQYPSTDEAHTALQAIENIYVDRQQVSQYVKYTKGLGGMGQVEASMEDSLTYVAAERVYMNSDFATSKKYLSNYLQKFPNGRYALNAHFYLGDCLLREKDYANAFNHYEVVVKSGWSMNSEEALSKVAAISFYQKEYQKALQYYQALQKSGSLMENLQDAKIGLMRCYFELENQEECAMACSEVLKETKLGPEVMREASYKRAKSYMALENQDAALVDFMEIANDYRTQEGAEAKYQVSQIYFEKGQTKKAEDEVYDFISKSTPHRYWLARSFILLADIFIQRNDDFGANQYLVSLQENYSGNDDILSMVEERLNGIENRKAEKAAQAPENIVPSNQ